MEAKLTLLDRLVKEAIGNNRILGGPDDEAVLSFPEVWEWLTRTRCGDEHVKQPARLSVTAIPGGWLASISDSTLCVTVDATTDKLQDAFGALERGLGNGTATIRTWGDKQATLKKQPKQKQEA